MYVLPSTLAKMNNNNKNDPLKENKKEDTQFLDMFVSILFEIPSTFAAYLMIERKGFGRRNSLIISFLLGSVTSIGAYSFSWDSFIYFSTATRFFFNMAFIFIYPFTIESYPTHIRATGLGTSSAFSRIGGVLMPWFILLGQKISLTGPFLIFAIMSGIASLAILLIPHDTTGRELDKSEENTTISDIKQV